VFYIHASVNIFGISLGCWLAVVEVRLKKGEHLWPVQVQITQNEHTYEPLKDSYHASGVCREHAGGREDVGQVQGTARGHI
jgi:hypothetical protein